MIRLKRAFNSFVSELKKDKSFIKGEQFEDEFHQELLKYNEIAVLEKSHHKNERGFIESNLNPDFKLKFKESDFVFWVECKFRSIIDEKSMIDIKNQNQYQRYKKIEEPLFYLINVNNELISLIPFDKIYPKMYLSHLEKYELQLPLNEDYLKKLLNNAN